MDSVCKSVMYGGSFDIVTKGHLYVIRKAVKMFSTVHVVVADNPSKSSMFSREDRVKMMRQMVREEFPNYSVIVSELPPNTYLVNWAKANDCQVLIRGIRDNIDFVYESTICRTNKMICPDVETIYFMPEDNVSVVSSSWVKGLLGIRGWQKIVKDAVPHCVFKVLQEKELHKKIDIIMNGLFSDTHIQFDHRERSVLRIKELMTAYRDRPYHNYEHILDGLEAFPKEHWEKPDYVMLYAWLMHDVNPSEDESIKIALDTMHLPFINKECVGRNVRENWEKATKKITDLIEATKHKTCEYETEEEKVFASVDLMNLGGTEVEYSCYNNLVCEEYREMAKEKAKVEQKKFYEDPFFYQWSTGRLEFVKRFLARKFIYPSAMFMIREVSARRNLEAEKKTLEDYMEWVNAMNPPM